MNFYEASKQKVIPAVLVYLKYQSKTLMLHRIKREEDYHRGKWNGLGGKFELGESPLEVAVRETEEESGIKVLQEQFKVLGVLQFPNFKPVKNEDWIVYVFTASVTQEQVNQLQNASDEGHLEWIEDSRLIRLNLWEGDRLFLPNVLNQNPFVGTVWYEGEKVLKSWFQNL